MTAPHSEMTTTAAQTMMPVVSPVAGTAAVTGLMEAAIATHEAMMIKTSDTDITFLLIASIPRPYPAWGYGSLIVMTTVSGPQPGIMRFPRRLRYGFHPFLFELFHFICRSRFGISGTKIPSCGREQTA